MRLVIVWSLAALSAIAFVGCFSSDKHPQTKRSAPPTSRPARRTRLDARTVGRLPGAVQLPAVTSLPGGRALVLGGLSSADSSLSTIVSVEGNRSRALGSLPQPLHDGAAATVAGQAYFFGGGGTAGSSADIVRVDPNGHPSPAGLLPAAASDIEAATVGDTAYIVGGYTGSTALGSIVAFRPGAPPRVVARLPVALRYAAVAAVAGRVMIAGGTSGSSLSKAIFAFDPRRRRVTRIGTLPASLTHAAGAALGGGFYVIGGRRALLGSQTANVLRVDPTSGQSQRVGQLPRPLSDAGALSQGTRILVVGGRDHAGQARTELVSLEPKRSTGTPAERAPYAGVGVDVYAADRPGRLSRVVRGDPPRIYVPNSNSDTVDVIDQRSHRIVDHFATGGQPQHVTPSWDLKTLWVTNDRGNTLTPIDPRTGHHGKQVPVDDPYNLYFTPNGRYAIVVAEQRRRLDFRDAHSMRLHHSLAVPCPGVDHMDFTADGRFLLASCEFGGRLIVVDVRRQRVVRSVALRPGAMPQDVKLSPDGRVFYVADMASDGVWLIGGTHFRKLGFVSTGRGAHGLYVSRDSRVLYVSNRGEGSISLISFRTRRPVKKWRLPGGGSPDMGGVSADGRVLWLSGRHNAEVYAISTRTGRLQARIKVGAGPHGLCVYPQPGRYSLGHTGVFR